jgi:hypothetical protein
MDLTGSTWREAGRGDSEQNDPSPIPPLADSEAPTYRTTAVGKATGGFRGIRRVVSLRVAVTVARTVMIESQLSRSATLVQGPVGTGPCIMSARIIAALQLNVRLLLKRAYGSRNEKAANV